MRLVRHAEALCDASVVRRVEVEVEVEVGVAMGLEASLPSWHGSRRNAEVMSGSETAVSQSLGQGGPLHRGRPAYNRAKGLVGVLNVASFPSFRRVRPGKRLVTVTSPSRTCATPNKGRGLTQSGRQLLHSVI